MLARRSIFWARVACGIPDITAAFVTGYLMRSTTPMRLLQGIAFGWLGAKSFSGGWTTAALGLACHQTQYRGNWRLRGQSA